MEHHHEERARLNRSHAPYLGVHGVSAGTVRPTRLRAPGSRRFTVRGRPRGGAVSGPGEGGGLRRARKRRGASGVSADPRPQSPERRQ